IFIFGSHFCTDLRLHISARLFGVKQTVQFFIFLHRCADQKKPRRRPGPDHNKDLGSSGMRGLHGKHRLALRSARGSLGAVTAVTYYFLSSPLFFGSRVIDVQLPKRRPPTTALSKKLHSLPSSIRRYNST